MKLAGIRVVEIGQVLAAPFAGMIFADLGAEVIKVEKPGGGDDARTMGPEFRDGASMTFHDVNRGKRSVQVDLKSAEGRAQLERLLADADVLIHNLRPGEAARMGVDAATLMPRFPRLVYCEITAFGHTGPRRLQPGYEPLLQAYSGLVSMNGSPEGPPARMGASLVDFGTGMWSVIGILAAVTRRRQTGEGARVDTSLLETGMAWMTNPIANYSASGKLPRRMGSATAMLAPYEVFESADAHVFIGCGADRMFQKLAAALGVPELARDPRFARNADRVANREALHEAIASVTRARETSEVVATLRAAGVPVSAVNDLSTLLRDEQVRTLGLHEPMPVNGTSLTAVGTPIRIDGERGYRPELAVGVGQDTTDVLAAAGFSAGEIAALAAAGAIGA